MLARCVRGLLGGLLSMSVTAHAHAQDVPGVSITVCTGSGLEQLVPALKVLMLLTVLSLAPAVVISMTSFTRIMWCCRSCVRPSARRTCRPRR